MKKNINQFWFSLCLYLTWATLFGLLGMILLLVFRASPILSLDFLTRSWVHQQPQTGGVFSAIVGSLVIGIGVVTLSAPLGIATAIYLVEIPGAPRLKRSLALAIRNLAGVPSIVYGLFGLAVFVQTLHFGTSLLSAIATLSCMSLPWIITSSVEGLESVSSSLRTSSLALGATRFQTILYVVLPRALPAALTGVILSLSRAMGETAPLILVGATFYLSRQPDSVFDKFMALPYHTFILATQFAHPLALELASATAVVLIATTCLLSMSAIIIRYALTRKD